MITEQQIREAAYYKWLRLGSPFLDEVGQNKLWLEAEEDLLRESQSAYRVLLKQGDLEVRKYYPQERLIVAARREYQLRFPYMVFAGRLHKEGSYLYLGFAKEDDHTIYFPSLPNVNSQTYGICLGRAEGHFQQRAGTTFNRLVEMFWTTEFDPWNYGWAIGQRGLQENFQGRLNYWKKLTFPEMFDHISYMPRSFDHFVGRVSKHYDDWTMRTMISDYTGCDPVTKKVIINDDEADSKAPVFRRNELDDVF